MDNKTTPLNMLTASHFIFKDTHKLKAEGWKRYFMKMKTRRHKNAGEALTSVAQLAGHHPTKHKVTSPILGQGTCLGCRFGH